MPAQSTQQGGARPPCAARIPTPKFEKPHKATLPDLIRRAKPERFYELANLLEQSECEPALNCNWLYRTAKGRVMGNLPAIWRYERNRADVSFDAEGVAIWQRGRRLSYGPNAALLADYLGLNTLPGLYALLSEVWPLDNGHLALCDRRAYALIEHGNPKLSMADVARLWGYAYGRLGDLQRLAEMKKAETAKRNRAMEGLAA